MDTRRASDEHSDAHTNTSTDSHTESADEYARADVNGDGRISLRGKVRRSRPEDLLLRHPTPA